MKPPYSKHILTVPFLIALCYVPGIWGGGGYSWEFLVGVCLLVLQILTLFQAKKCNFPDLFSDQTSKVHTRCQTCPLDRYNVIITRLERRQKSLLKLHIYLSFLLIWN